MPPILHYSHPHSDRQLPSAAFALQGDPLAAGRVIHYHDPLQGYAAGSSVSTGADLVIESFPWVELGVIEAGELRLRGEGFDLQLAQGDCFVVPRGVRVHWQQQGQLRRVFMAFPGLSACTQTPAVPLRVDLSQPLAPSSPPAASVLLTATPKAFSETLFSAGNLRIGLWQCEAYARRQVQPAYSELMYILEGSVTLTAPQGDGHPVKAGETVIVPKGATNAWVSEETVRKVFCILS
ncbi:cupin domain-containing protein [Pseudomonas sp. S2_E01]